MDHNAINPLWFGETYFNPGSTASFRSRGVPLPTAPVVFKMLAFKFGFSAFSLAPVI